MPQIEPFRALRYNPRRVGDLGAVLCPPYDVISPTEQQRLQDLSPFNIVRVELGQDEPGDSDESNRYSRAADALAVWQSEGALVQDPRPGYYLVAHTYRASGREYTRRGIFAAQSLISLCLRARK